MHSMGMNCTRRRHRTVKPVRTNIYTKHAAEVEEDNIKKRKKKIILLNTLRLHACTYSSLGYLL